MKLVRWGLYSIGINIMLASISLAVALSSGSLAVKAEIVHNIVDMLTASTVLVGLRIAGHKSKRFPYGLYKVENIVALIMAMAIFLTAYEVGRSAVLGTEYAITAAWWNVAALLVAMGIALGFSWAELHVGRKSNSPALIADAKEYRVHLLTTGLLVATLAGSRLNVNIDRWAALIVALVIAKTGWDLLFGGIRVLLDASLEPEEIEQIRKLMLEQAEVAEVKSITGRNAGRVRFVEGTITLRVRDLEKVEHATTEIENRVQDLMPNVERVLIHAEPNTSQHHIYAVPLQNTSGALSEQFGEAPFFAVLTVERENVIVQNKEIVKTPDPGNARGKGIRIAEWLVEKKVDTVFVSASLHGKGPEYVFSNAGINIESTSAKALGEIEQSFADEQDIAEE